MLDLSLIFDGTPPKTGVAITATRQSTNIIDLLTSRDIGAGDEVEFHVLVTQNFATLTSLQIQLQLAITSGGTYRTILETDAIPVANLLAGTEFKYKVPMYQLMELPSANNGLPYQFMALNYVVAGSNATTGAVFAYLTGGGDQPTTVQYPRGFTIDA